MNYRTEDEVRDSAKLILGFDKTEPKVKQGTGQITTFNQLGFKGVIDKPDGWYFSLFGVGRKRNGVMAENGTAPRDTLSRSTKKRPGGMKPHGRMKLHIHLCTV